MTQSSTADRKSIRAAERRARETDRTRGEVLINLMGTIPGRAWVWDRLEAANIFASTYNDNPQRMAFLEGHRTAGLQLLGDLMQWCPDLFIQAMREANARRTESAAADAPGSTTGSEYSGSEEPGRELEDPGTAPAIDPDTGEVRWN